MIGFILKANTYSLVKQNRAMKNLAETKQIKYGFDFVGKQ